MKKLLFIVESSVLGIKYLCQAAKNMGITPIVLSEIINQEGDAKLEILNENYIKCQTSTTNGIITAIKEYLEKNKDHLIEGIISLLDSRIQFCVESSEYFGFKGLESSCALAKNKLNVSIDIKKYSPEIYLSNGSNLSDIHKIFKNGNRICIKLKSGAGGKGFFIADNYEILMKEILSRASSLEDFFKNHFLQKHIEGDLVSIEGYFLEEEINIFGFTGRRKVKDTESSLIFPYSDLIKDSCKEKIYNCLIEMKNKYNFKSSFFHIEFILNNDEIYLIDANIGRPPGGNLIELICYSLNIDVDRFFENYLSVNLYKIETIDLNKKIIRDNIFFFSNYLDCKNKYLGVGYGVPISTNFISLNLKKKAAISYINAVDTNTPVRPMGETNWAWIGMISGKENDVIKELEEISIITSNGEFKPIWK